MYNLDVLGDEYHFFFECVKPDIVTLRQQCIPRYYLQGPSMFKLIQLLKSSDDVKIGKRMLNIHQTHFLPARFKIQNILFTLSCVQLHTFRLFTHKYIHTHT